jgi:hypothetical protein
MEGLSDFSDYINSIINKVISLVIYRVGTITAPEMVQEKFIPLMNRALELIEGSIPIPGTDLHIDIGFADAI